MPTQDEVPAGAVDAPAPPLTPDEEAQIEIDQPHPQFVDATNQLQTPPLLGQDAVSGGMMPEQHSAAAMPAPSYGPGGLELHTDLPDDYLSDEELGQKFASLKPEQQQIERQKIEAAKQKFAAARSIEESEKTLRQAEENARVRQEAMREAQKRGAELDAEAKQLADANPLDSISGSRKVFGVLASIVGGWLVPKTGRNMGLEAVDSIANEAAQLQSQKIAVNGRRRAAAGEDFGRADDSYRGIGSDAPRCLRRRDQAPRDGGAELRPARHDGAARDGRHQRGETAPRRHACEVPAGRAEASRGPAQVRARRHEGARPVREGHGRRPEDEPRGSEARGRTRRWGEAEEVRGHADDAWPSFARLVLRFQRESPNPQVACLSIRQRSSPRPARAPRTGTRPRARTRRMT
jgi:hypothetical protein